MFFCSGRSGLADPRPPLVENFTVFFEPFPNLDVIIFLLGRCAIRPITRSARLAGRLAGYTVRGKILCDYERTSNKYRETHVRLLGAGEDIARTCPSFSDVA